MPASTSCASTAPARSRLVVDGDVLQLRTHALTIDQVLDEADVVLEQRDSVLQNGVLVDVNAPVDPPRLLATIGLDAVATTVAAATIELEVQPRGAVHDHVRDGRELATTSSRPTVAQALREAGIVVGPGDRVTPTARRRVAADMRIDVVHARAPSRSRCPTATASLYTLARTVREALDDEGITLPDGAFVDPSLDTRIVGRHGGARRAARLVRATSSASTSRAARVYRRTPASAPARRAR